jgi:hypothetical protein
MPDPYLHTGPKSKPHRTKEARDRSANKAEYVAAPRTS